MPWRKISEWEEQKKNHFHVYLCLHKNRLAWFTEGTNIVYSQFWVHWVWVQVLCSLYDLVCFSHLFGTSLMFFIWKQVKPLMLMNYCQVYKSGCSCIPPLLSLPLPSPLILFVSTQNILVIPRLEILNLNWNWKKGNTETEIKKEIYSHLQHFLHWHKVPRASNFFSRTRKNSLFCQSDTATNFNKNNRF